MHKGQTVFLQLTDHLPLHMFRRLVKREALVPYVGKETLHPAK